MASVSVVGPGQHRPAPDHQRVFHKLKAAGRNKITLPWKSSVEIIIGKSSVTRECGSVSAVSAVTASPLNPSLTPGQQGAVAGVGGGDPGVRCEAQSGLVPRSSDRESDSSSPDYGDTEGDTTAAREKDTGQSGRSGSGNDSTHDRRNSLKTLTNVMSSTSANTQMTDVKRDRSSAPTNGHIGAHSHRDSLVRRRASHSPHGQTTGLGTKGNTGGPPLERLTQGRTGVVKLARTESYRREVWSIFGSQDHEDARVRSETGEGHKFGTRTVTQDWCDVCNQRISAQQALKCKNCNYTCHQECGGQVQLDCNQRDSNPQETTSPRRHCSTPPQYKQKEVEEERGPKALSEEDLRARIDDYNSTVSENGMKLGADGLYTGFIKVHLRLSRPVTVLAVEGTGLDGQAERHGQPMTVSEGQEGAGAGLSEKRTSFYLPSDCVKQIHISSTTTVREVIQGLLKKFMVLDNPSKFALYRQTHRDGQDLFQKLPLVECPLALRLVVGPDPELLSFVLKENETGEVEWHAFSVPELQNFLVILEKEEADRVRLVEQRFAVYRQNLQKALGEDKP